MKGALITAAAFAIGVAMLISTVVPGVDAAKPTPAALTISANPTAVKAGGSVTLSGKLTGSNVASKNVRVEQDPFPLGGGFDNAGSATTNASGDWALVVKPTANTRYRAGSGKTDSSTLDVTVRPSVTLKLSDRTPRRAWSSGWSAWQCPQAQNGYSHGSRWTEIQCTVVNSTIAHLPL